MATSHGVLHCVALLILCAGVLPALGGRLSVGSPMPGWATPKTFHAPAPNGHTVHFAVHLPWRKEAELEAFAQAVSTPRSSLYKKFLSPKQFLSKYAPLSSDAEKVASWLRSEGLGVVHIAISNKYVIAEGSVAAVAKAFKTKFGLYKYGSNIVRVPTLVPTVPASLASLGALRVVGLDQSTDVKKSRVAKREEGGLSTGSEPSGKGSSDTLCFWTLPSSPGGNSSFPRCGYKASQLRAVYGVPKNLDGAGQEIAIVDAYASPFAANDLILWSIDRGIEPSLFSQYYPPYNYTKAETLVNPSPGYFPGWQVEEMLDLDVVHGLAPKAKIMYMGAQSNNDADLIAAITAVLDYGLASVISNSYGGPLPPPQFQNVKVTRAANQPWTDTLIRAALQGIGVFFSSGDDGDYAFAASPYNFTTTTDYPASDPWAIAVGGTTLGIGPNNERLFEYYWGEYNTSASGKFLNYVFGAGGGISSAYPVPFYQKTGKVRSFLKTYGKSVRRRVVPDISADADPYSGYLVGESIIGLVNGTGYYADYQFYGPAYSEVPYGGTSFSCPMTATFVALAQQLKDDRFGFINPLLYSVSSKAFIDIVAPPAPLYLKSSRGFHYRYAVTPPGIVATTGYDSATGLGVPSKNFWKLLASF